MMKTFRITVTEHSYCLLSYNTKSSLFQEFVPYSMHTLMFSEDIVQIQQLIADSNSHIYRSSTETLHFSVWHLLRKAVVAMSRTTSNTSVAQRSPYETERVRLSSLMSWERPAWWTFQNPCILWVTLQPTAERLSWPPWRPLSHGEKHDQKQIRHLNIWRRLNFVVRWLVQVDDGSQKRLHVSDDLRHEYSSRQRLQDFRKQTEYRWKYWHQTKITIDKRKLIFLISVLSGRDRIVSTYSVQWFNNLNLKSFVQVSQISSWSYRSISINNYTSAYDKR